MAVEILCHWNRPRAIDLLRSLVSFLLAFLEKDGPQDGNKSAYVKKSVLFERSVSQILVS